MYNVGTDNVQCEANNEHYGPSPINTRAKVRKNMFTTKLYAQNLEISSFAKIIFIIFFFVVSRLWRVIASFVARLLHKRGAVVALIVARLCHGCGGIVSRT